MFDCIPTAINLYTTILSAHCYFLSGQLYVQISNTFDPFSVWLSTEILLQYYLKPSSRKTQIYLTRWKLCQVLVSLPMWYAVWFIPQNVILAIRVCGYFISMVRFTLRLPGVCSTFFKQNIFSSFFIWSRTGVISVTICTLRDKIVVYGLANCSTISLCFLRRVFILRGILERQESPHFWLNSNNMLH